VKSVHKAQPAISKLYTQQQCISIQCSSCSAATLQCINAIAHTKIAHTNWATLYQPKHDAHTVECCILALLQQQHQQSRAQQANRGSCYGVCSVPQLACTVAVCQCKMHVLLLVHVVVMFWHQCTIMTSTTNSCSNNRNTRRDCGSTGASVHTSSNDSMLTVKALIVAKHSAVK
jgi:hypothetical protein